MAQEIIFKGGLVGVSPARYWGPANSPLKVFTAILRRRGACLSCPWTYLLKSAITPPLAGASAQYPGGKLIGPFRCGLNLAIGRLGGRPGTISFYELWPVK